jgi:hypothetical protein
VWDAPQVVIMLSRAQSIFALISVYIIKKFTTY